MKKSDPDHLSEHKSVSDPRGFEEQAVKQPFSIDHHEDQHTGEEANSCPEYRELRKDKKYINKIDQILCYHDRSLPLHILIVVTFRENDCVIHVPEVYETLKHFNTKFFLDSRTYHDLENYIQQNKKNHLSLTWFSEFDPDIHSKIIDIVITIGGDGIILKAASFFSNRATPPMITFEKEIHGFLQNFKIGEIKGALPRIFTGIFQGSDTWVERRMRIHAKIIKKHENAIDEDILSFSALNEIIVDRGPSPMCVKSEIYLNNKLVTTNFGDGLIISSPTGSTAYAISANGPIIHNYVDIIISLLVNYSNFSIKVRSLNLVPICPHSLSFRPLVVPSDCVIKIKTSRESRASAFISSDGKRIFELSSNFELIVTESQFDAFMLIENPELIFERWIYRLKQLLNWNLKFVN